MAEHFSQWFLSPDSESGVKYASLMKEAEAIIDRLRIRNSPFSGMERERISEGIKEIANFPKNGRNEQEVMKEIEDRIASQSLWVSHPDSMAHLHCPPLIPSLAAEVIISALNQSMDSWDQSPAATFAEIEIVRNLAERIGFPEEADGVFTSGGTQSNYMGILLARNEVCRRLFHTDVQKEGLPDGADRLRILCSEHAHFTVAQSAAQLGLGEDAVVCIPANERQELCMQSAREEVRRLKEQGLIPFLIVATAGTTDFGSVAPIPEAARLAREEQLWLHVDAAYGGGLLFSRGSSSLLNGLESADSVAIDFHKLFYQSISCGAFLVKNKRSFSHIVRHADYLNPESDHASGIPNLVEKSVQTTRRFDALKVLLTFQLLGTDLFGRMIEKTMRLAKETAELLKASPRWELGNEPVLTAVLFRYIPNRSQDAEYTNNVNLEIHRRLFESGKLIMARTRHKGKVYLKFTMLNPMQTLSSIREHLIRLEETGRKIEQEQEVIIHG